MLYKQLDLNVFSVPVCDNSNNTKPTQKQKDLKQCQI